ncbi:MULTISPECIES: LysR family transcriptional regulator [Burkholderia]|uniref:LysR substrate-binding domain-containing protein n=1 Tax=Burkholderia anthinoferrum TaxID=3090833 RepID=A0ABU5WNH9_9BURK|nr:MULTISPECIES: LysR family transcriptional regulator [Burkholderia]MEB2504729.1 LysR substrate-binding domain-containing protein [Burkholderia anthinoferrum]MEB2531274.1 LysR substrate-binding domain-containing protein [Burkholderia anthinoferrum]MEB2560794.1 LysR substrate-binding domain-containing protein [Burkholderia anthinoferrum]MEB2580541.1 LysR substrate-binding domain-containing protein [Burkholderia anthinoferrum]KVH07277.1 LysR family transcriptional regulator [Burkholderia anthin
MPDTSIRRPDADDPFARSFSTCYAGVVTFLAVVTEGSFARAADRLGVGRSSVSRHVQRLEDRLDARLFQRTTRSMSLTREGELFYENCRPGIEHLAQALEDMRELRSGPPSGHLRIGATPGFGRKVIAPLLRDFHAQYPDITLELLLNDRPVDFSADRIDVAFRDGRMEDSAIVARRLIPMQMIVCASPSYAHQHGLPRHVDDLERHRCINLRTASGRVTEWEFRIDGVTQQRQIAAHHTFNDIDLVVQAALDGLGIAQLPAYQVCDLLADGRLVSCLGQHAPDDGGHYLCYLSRKHLPTRIRVFIDYMIEQTRARELHCPATMTTMTTTAPLEAVD